MGNLWNIFSKMLNRALTVTSTTQKQQVNKVHIHFQLKTSGLVHTMHSESITSTTTFETKIYLGVGQQNTQKLWVPP